MTTATRADAEQLPLSVRRRSAASLASVPKIPPRRRETAPGTQKRAAVVLRRGMKQNEFRRIEEQLDIHSLTSFAVLPGQRRMVMADTPVCGLIVTGGDMDPSHAERDLIVEAVQDTMARAMPVIAMSDAVSLVLEAAGVKGVVAEGRGVMLHGDNVRVLESAKELDEAIKLMAKLTPR